MTPAPPDRPHPLPAGVVEGEARRRYTPPKRACEKCGSGILEDWTGRHCERCTFAAHDRDDYSPTWETVRAGMARGTECVAAMRGVRVTGDPEGAVRELRERAMELATMLLHDRPKPHRKDCECRECLFWDCAARFHVEEGDHG